MKVGVCGSEGWSAIAFSKTNSIKDMTFGVISFKINKTRPVYTLSSHYVLKDQISYTPLISEKTFEYWNMNGFIIKLNYTFDWNYAFFACKKSSSSFFGIPLETYDASFDSINKTFVFPRHNKVTLISKVEKDQCYTYGYKITDFTLSKEFTIFWFINVVILVVLLLLAVFFRHRAPLSTKGSIPFLALGLFILQSINSLLYVVSPSFEFVYHYGCFFSGTFDTPARMTLIVLFFFSNMKNLTTLFIKNNVKNLYENDDEKSTKIFIIKVLKYFTHDVMVILVTLATYAIVFSIHAITFGYTYPKEKFQCSLSLQTYFEPMYFFIAILSIIFLVIEFLLNFKKIYQDHCKLFWLRDPHGITLQQINLVFIILFSFFAFIFFFILLFYENGEVMIAGSSDVTYESEAAFYYGFSTLEYITEINYFIGVVLFFTIVKTISSLIMGRRMSIDQLQEILENKKVFQPFKEYCEKQWDLEYCLFLEDVQTFYLAQEKKRISLATRIGRLYLSGTTAALELSIPGDLSRVFFETVTENTRKRTEMPDSTFDSILKIVHHRLLENFIIFSQTQEFSDTSELEEISETKDIDQNQ
eukprot:gene5550-9369_t